MYRWKNTTKNEARILGKGTQIFTMKIISLPPNAYNHYGLLSTQSGH